MAQLSEVTQALLPPERQKLHSSIIEDSDQGILITDVHERIVSVNAAFTNITGYQPHEAIGKTTDLLRSGVHDSNFRAQVLSAVQGSGPWLDLGLATGRRNEGCGAVLTINLRRFDVVTRPLATR